MNKISDVLLVGLTTPSSRFPKASEIPLYRFGDGPASTGLPTSVAYLSLTMAHLEPVLPSSAGNMLRLKIFLFGESLGGVPLGSDCGKMSNWIACEQGVRA